MNPMRRNICLYPWYTALFQMLAWMPIFFLYFSQYLPLEQVLQLEALYYVAVVILEIPSGYFSDTIGRRSTLLISGTAMVMAYLFFLMGANFWMFAAGQILLAAGFSFRSGTDTSFHYDSLVALNQTAEYAEREAIAVRNGFVANALAVFAGGFLGALSLRLAYGIALLGAIGAFVIVLYFREPDRTGADSALPLNFRRQVWLCLTFLKRRTLAWIFAHFILMIVLNHIPYEFYQPYLNLLRIDLGFGMGAAPVAAGIVMGLSTLAGAGAAARSIWLRDRIGFGPAMLLTSVIPLVLIGAMGWWLHVLVVPLILLRTIPQALMAAPLNAAIAPQIPQAQRATYLSVQSLAGRLAFSATLLGLSAVAGATAAVDWPTLALMLRLVLLCGLGGFIILVATMGLLGPLAHHQSR